MALLAAANAAVAQRHRHWGHMSMAVELQAVRKSGCSATEAVPWRVSRVGRAPGGEKAFDGEEQGDDGADEEYHRQGVEDRTLRRT